MADDLHLAVHDDRGEHDHHGRWGRRGCAGRRAACVARRFQPVWAAYDLRADGGALVVCGVAVDAHFVNLAGVYYDPVHHGFTRVRGYISQTGPARPTRLHHGALVPLHPDPGAQFPGDFGRPKGAWIRAGLRKRRDTQQGQTHRAVDHPRDDERDCLQRGYCQCDGFAGVWSAQAHLALRAQVPLVGLRGDRIWGGDALGDPIPRLRVWHAPVRGAAVVVWIF